MPGDGVRTSPVHGWLGYCWLISFWRVMSPYFQTVVMLGMSFPMFLFVLNACILTVLFVILSFLSCCFTYLPCHITCCIPFPISCHYA